MNVVIRGDVNYIRIGNRTSIQDLTMVHVQNGTHATVIGDDVTVGHSALLHGCTIGNDVPDRHGRAAAERRHGRRRAVSWRRGRC